MKLEKLPLVLVILLLTSSFVGAFGVSSSYWDTNPLIMFPGETRDFTLSLQNTDSSEDITLRATVSRGYEIATITDSSLDYFVPSGKKGVMVNLRVTIPENTPIGTEHIVGVLFKEVTATEEGEMMQIATGIEKLVPVVVGERVVEETVEEETTPANTGLLTFFLVAVVVVVLFTLFRGKKKKKK